MPNTKLSYIDDFNQNLQCLPSSTEFFDCDSDGMNVVYVYANFLAVISKNTCNSDPWPYAGLVWLN